MTRRPGPGLPSLLCRSETNTIRAGRPPPCGPAAARASWPACSPPPARREGPASDEDRTGPQPHRRRQLRRHPHPARPGGRTRARHADPALHPRGQGHARPAPGMDAHARRPRPQLARAVAAGGPRHGERLGTRAERPLRSRPGPAAAGRLEPRRPAARRARTGGAVAPGGRHQQRRIPAVLLQLGRANLPARAGRPGPHRRPRGPPLPGRHGRRHRPVRRNERAGGAARPAGTAHRSRFRAAVRARSGILVVPGQAGCAGGARVCRGCRRRCRGRLRLRHKRIRERTAARA